MKDVSFDLSVVVLLFLLQQHLTAVGVDKRDVALLCKCRPGIVLGSLFLFLLCLLQVHN